MASLIHVSLSPGQTKHADRLPHRYECNKELECLDQIVRGSARLQMPSATTTTSCSPAEIAPCVSAPHIQGYRDIPRNDPERQRWPTGYGSGLHQLPHIPGDSAPSTL